MKNKLDPHIVNTEFERLKALNYFPMDEGVQNELKRALNSAPNEIVMAAAVNEWMETQSERPTPADIYRVIREQIEKADDVRYWKPEDEPTPTCLKCTDSGMCGGTRAEPWSFCDCQVGLGRQYREPHAVDEANKVRDKLFGKFGTAVDRLDRMTRGMNPKSVNESVTRQLLSDLDPQRNT